MIQSLEPGYARIRIRIRILDSAGTWSVSQMIQSLQSPDMPGYVLKVRIRISGYSPLLARGVYLR